MKVKRTLHEIYAELAELKVMKEATGIAVANSMVNGTENSVKHFLEDFKHLSEVIKYLSHIEVEYEDKYEMNEVEEE